MATCTYRLGTVDDIDAVFDLNQQLFAEKWSKKSLLDVMQSGFDLYVCESDKKIAAYILSQDILDEVHIMQVAVAPAYQRQGIAKALSTQLIHDKQGYQLILLEVRASNLAAHALYSQLSFAEIGRRKGYYVPETKGEAREDAIVMQLSLKTP